MNSFRRPRFKRHYHVRVWPPDTVVLFWEAGNIRLRGTLTAMLAPLLDGSHSFDEIVDRLGDRITALDVQFGLSQLAARGYLTEADDAAPADLATFRDLLNVSSQPVDSASVTIRACSGVKDNGFAEALKTLRIRVEDSGSLTVVLVDHYLQPELEAFHREAIDTARPWMIVKPVGSVLAIGPLFRPGHGACWNCLALRLRESPETQALLPVLENGRYSLMDLPAVRNIAFHLAAIEVWKWFAGASGGEIERNILTLDTARMSLDRHAVVLRDDCPDCGRAPEASPAPLVLRSRKKIFTSDGGHRPADPSVVFERYKHHISALTGVVHSLSAVDGLDKDRIHVYAAGHNFALDPRNDDVIQRLEAISRGKGLSPIQARTSALCEALERYAGVFRGNEIRRKARMDQLDGEAIHPNACMNFSRRQYETQRPWDGNPRDWVPQPFDESREVEWTPVWSLTGQRFKYLPTACCYYGYPCPPDHHFARADSNGCAAGVTLEDAILQGFLELVERDAMSVWWHNRLTRPSIDLREQHEFADIRNSYARLGRDVWVLDITADLGIPVAVALSMRSGSIRDHLLLGAGAHFDPRIAVARALTEMNQALPSAQNDQRSDEEFCAQSFLHPVGTWDGRSSPPCSDDLRDDVETCVRLAAQQGLEVLVLDQTRSDLGLPVVKVIVPGMRHVWRRLGPGRLYDVPVSLGWLAAPLAEEQLNPAVIGM